MSRLKKFLAGLAILLLLVVVVSGVGIWWIGAWGIIFPSDAYETEAPELTADFGEDAVLRVAVYTKTNSFRHTEGTPTTTAWTYMPPRHCRPALGRTTDVLLWHFHQLAPQRGVARQDFVGPLTDLESPVDCKFILLLPQRMHSTALQALVLFGCCGCGR